MLQEEIVGKALRHKCAQQTARSLVSGAGHASRRVRGGMEWGGGSRKGARRFLPQTKESLHSLVKEQERRSTTSRGGREG